MDDIQKIAEKYRNETMRGMAPPAHLPQIKKETAFSALNEFDPALSRLEALIANIGECADRIVGSMPSDVDKGTSTPALQHLIYSIQARKNRLVTALDRLEVEVQRLSNGLMD